MTLYLVGLGPSPELADLTQRAAQTLAQVERVVLDDCTAAGSAARQRALTAVTSAPIELSGPLDAAARAALIEDAATREVALAVAGDPLVATPYVHLLRAARSRGIVARVVPGLSAPSAVISLAGFDASAAITAVVEDPAAPTERERAQLSRTLAGGRPLVVIAAGRSPEATEAAWRSLAQVLAADHGVTAQLCAIDAGGWALVIGDHRGEDASS